jgi:hypothetical protein
MKDWCHLNFDKTSTTCGGCNDIRQGKPYFCQVLAYGLGTRQVSTLGVLGSAVWLFDGVWLDDCLSSKTALLPSLPWLWLTSYASAEAPAAVPQT